jgi:hypothetical protein
MPFCANSYITTNAAPQPAKMPPSMMHVCIYITTQEQLNRTSSNWDRCSANWAYSTAVIFYSPQQIIPWETWHQQRGKVTNSHTTTPLTNTIPIQEHSKDTKLPWNQYTKRLQWVHKLIKLNICTYSKGPRHSVSSYDITIDTTMIIDVVWCCCCKYKIFPSGQEQSNMIQNKNS